MKQKTLGDIILNDYKTRAINLTLGYDYIDKNGVHCHLGRSVYLEENEITNNLLYIAYTKMFKKFTTTKDDELFELVKANMKKHNITSILDLPVDYITKTDKYGTKTVHLQGNY